MIAGLIILLAAIAVRFYISYLEKEKERESLERYSVEDNYGMAQTNGDYEIQSDCVEVINNKTGQLAVLADGIGKENTGKISAQIAADVFIAMFGQYKNLDKPAYFFKKGFHAAHQRIQQSIGERHGGASVAAAYINRGRLCYALAGDTKILLYRRGNLIPLSEGHTVDILAEQAYIQGKITKQEALWSLKQKRLWNYVGMDGFRDIEIFDTPIKLCKGDIVVLMTKGIFSLMPSVELEIILHNKKYTAEEKAHSIISALHKIKTNERDNGSVIILETNRWVS